MIKIAPSLLAADMGDLRRAVAQVEAAGADYLHLDVMDGAFVPNISYGPAVIKALRPNSQLFFDVHLMVEEPGRFLSDYAAAGADLLTVHFEACRHLHRVVQQIKALGLKAGVALNPATPPEVLQDILPELDLVLIMSVNPGFGGQSFIPAALGKIARTAAMLRPMPAWLCRLALTCWFPALVFLVSRIGRLLLPVCVQLLKNNSQIEVEINILI